MILAISGSLKRSSINSAVLRAAALAAARERVVVDIADSVRQLPHFDPDLEGMPPDVVLRFRARCKSAAGLLFAVPEYAYGIPGSFKNALDWTVGSGARAQAAGRALARPARGDPGEQQRQGGRHGATAPPPLPQSAEQSILNRHSPGGVSNEGDEMQCELLIAFQAIRRYQTVGVPIDLGLGGAHHAQPRRRRLFPAPRTLAARLLRKEGKR